MSKKDLSTEERNKVVQFILGACINGKPPRGKMKEVQQIFNISRQTVSRLWAAAKEQQGKWQSIHLVSKKKHRKKHKVLQLDLTLLSSIEYSKRGTQSRLALGLGVSRTAIGRWVNSGILRAHTSALKPDLTQPNKLLRMRFSLEALELDLVFHRIMFKDMHNTVHIEEMVLYDQKLTQILLSSRRD